MHDTNKIICPNAVLDLNYVVSLQVIKTESDTKIVVRYQRDEREMIEGQAAVEIAQALSLRSAISPALKSLSDSANHAAV
jgi:hypothetical protein